MGELKNGIETYYADSAKAWREWLYNFHQSRKAVWLILYKKQSGVATLTVGEAIDEALCFGWVDSKPNKRDEKSYFLFFSQRNPKSNWSSVNKENVARLLKAKKMEAAGLRLVELAKQNGTWNALDDVENLVIPDDLLAAFAMYTPAKDFWDAFPRSTKRGILEWILQAMRPETRAKRIAETARLAQQNLRANQYPKRG